MILLTGATGLVGSHVLLKLLEKGEQVRATWRLGSRRERLGQLFAHYTDKQAELLSRVEWMETDLSDPYSVAEALQGVDRVIHTAAVVSFARRDRQQMREVNVETTARLVDLSLEMGVRRFVFVSSVAAIGSNDDGTPVNEDTNWNDSPDATAYGRSKHDAEMEVWRGAEEGLDVVIVNPSTIIGPGEWGRGSTALIHRLWKGMKTYTEGVTGYIDVRDVADAILLLLESDISGERFLLSSANLSYRELFGAVTREFGHRPPSVKVNRLMAAIAWRAEAIRCALNGKPPMITRETAVKAFSVVRYDGSRIGERTGFGYRDIIADSVPHTCACLQKDLGS